MRSNGVAVRRRRDLPHERPEQGERNEKKERLAPPEGAAAAAAAPGAGLGLAFVKAVIERHRGTISVTSAEGKGSTFGFRLPRAS